MKGQPPFMNRMQAQRSLIHAIIAAAFGMLSVAHAQSDSDKKGCLVAEFRTMALKTHDVGQRVERVEAWLRKHGSSCTKQQLDAIKNNRPAWLGAADSPEVMGIIDGMLEAKISSNPELMAQFYEAKGREPVTTAEVFSSTGYRPPPPPPPVKVVAPPPPPPVMVAPILGMPEYAVPKQPPLVIPKQPLN
jgi:hypothetical protein